MKRDGHIHSPFCPHGSSDTFVQYIEKAISHRFTDITFTEHAPLPNNFVDPTPQKDSGMKPNDLMPYIEELQRLQKQYAQDIRIRIGLEVDYIPGFEQETREFLNTYGHFLDDAILSVHFLKWQDSFVCIDFSPECFMDFSKKLALLNGFMIYIMILSYNRLWLTLAHSSQNGLDIHHLFINSSWHITKISMMLQESKKY